MNGYVDREEVEFWLRYYGKIKPDEAFWAKADEYGLHKTYYAIRKAAEEDQYTIEYITKLIGNVVREGDKIVYRQGVDRSCFT